MTTKQWLATVRAFPARLLKINRTVDDGMSVAMFALWLLMRKAPSTERALYERFSEADFAPAVAEITPRLKEDAYGFDASALFEGAAAVFAIGAHLRALDLLTADLHMGGIAADPAKAYLVKFGNERGFVIPVERQLWRAQIDAAKNKAPFDQRAVIKHRILPGTIDGAKVVPYRGHWPSSKEKSAVFGAALFPGLDFTDDKDDTTFLVTGVTCAQIDTVVYDALANSHFAACLATTFPELTIDDTMLGKIIEALETKPWYDDEEAGSGRTPAVIVAGSWHRKAGDNHYNLAPVRNGDGKPILEHRKRKPFKDEDGRYERIASGSELPILVFDHCLFAFGICLDFCDQRYDFLYDDLDVDLILVPSCGHDTTMESHLENAKLLLRRRKSRTMVVQQVYPAEPSRLGYVLAPRAKVPASVDQTAQTKSWTVVETQFTLSR